MPKKRYPIRSSADERQQLRGYVNHGLRSVRRINRARILLFADEQWSDDEITSFIGVNRTTVHGFPIVSAKFWGLRLSEAHRRLEDFRLFSDTIAPNELMRQCFMRRQSERLLPRVQRLFSCLPKCRSKRTFFETARKCLGKKA